MKTDATQRSAQRSSSVPIMLTNLNEPKDRTTVRTVDELTNENGLSYNTKL